MQKVLVQTVAALSLLPGQYAAIICVTHDEMILDRFDHIFRLRDGRLEREASADDRREITLPTA